MGVERWDSEYAAGQLEALADEILDISASLNGCGEGIACRKCSAKLISVASRYRAGAARIRSAPKEKKAPPQEQ